MALNTTTWEGRNKPHLVRTKDIAKEVGLYNPTILEYGPGGTISFIASYLPQGDREMWDNRVRLRKNLLKLADSTLRRTRLFSLETSEPREIADLMSDLSPKQIYVIDKEKRVIDAVRQMSEKAGFVIPIRPYLLNIEKSDFQEEQGDIVFAYNVVQRTRHPGRTLERIAKTTRIGGLLSANIPYAPEGFYPVGKEVYYRVH